MFEYRGFAAPATFTVRIASLPVPLPAPRPFNTIGSGTRVSLFAATPIGLP
jgi:hypothetical protein